MSYELHRDEYRRLIRELIRSQMSVVEFVDSFVELWTQDRDAQYDTLTEAQRQQWARALERPCSKSDLTRLFKDLFNVQEPDYICFLDRIFSACNQYTSDPELLSTGCYYNEEQLRNYVADVVALSAEKGWV